MQFADVHQERIDAHTYEDDQHWPCYLEDLSKLGLNQITMPTNLMKFLWGDTTCTNRILMYRLAAMIDRATSLERMAIVEAIEETGHVLFREVLSIARTLEDRIGDELRYCGSHHFNLESARAMGSDHRELAAIELDHATYERCVRFVEEVFEVFARWTEELLRFAKIHGGSARIQAHDLATSLYG